LGYRWTLMFNRTLQQKSDQQLSFPAGTCNGLMQDDIKELMKKHDNNEGVTQKQMIQWCVSGTTANRLFDSNFISDQAKTYKMPSTSIYPLIKSITESINKCYNCNPQTAKTAVMYLLREGIYNLTFIDSCLSYIPPEEENNNKPFEYTAFMVHYNSLLQIIPKFMTMSAGPSKQKPAPQKIPS